MDRRIRLRDGIEIGLTTGETVVLDGAPAGDEPAALSHAHADHLFARGADEVVCSPLTGALAEARRDDIDRIVPSSHPAIELVNAGHVAGSRAIYIDDGAETVLYTGDISVRDRLYLDGFDPPAADVLVLEATYGNPQYTFPPTDAVTADILEWLDSTLESPVLLFGYSLGRAQKLQVLTAQSDRTRVFTTAAIQRVNRVVESHLDVSFTASEYTDDVTLEPGDALVLPSQTNRRSFVEDLQRASDALTAGFSGWAADRSFKYRGGYDETFVLSDHCDFTELLGVVDQVDPEIVYTHHGFADELATHVTREFGIEARTLKRNQRSLDDFL